MRKRERLDELLVLNGLAASRTQAKGLIMSGQVRSGSQILDKPGKEYPRDLDLEVQQGARFVSRGGEKLEGFFQRFPWQITGKRVLDVGASTGGFTDYLLQNGASEAVCVDVGHGQLHYRLRTDPRVTNLERVNARKLSQGQLPATAYPIIVMDLSFISLRLILPVVWPLLQTDGILVALIKPQFEAGKTIADRFSGVIDDIQIRENIRDELLDFAAKSLPKSHLHGCCESPITGVTGNQEYLAGWTKGS